MKLIKGGEDPAMPKHLEISIPAFSSPPHEDSGLARRFRIDETSEFAPPVPHEEDRKAR